jgi:putative Ca2+/H+ antiporter (TMEM165/GDT1 family)
MSLQQRNRTALRLCILLGIALSFAVSVPLTAYIGSIFGDTYNQRVLIYAGQLLWLVAGSASILYATRGADERPASLGFLILCFISIWLWPIVLILSALRSRRS